MTAVAPIDDAHLKLGLLMETAQSHQSLVETSLQQLHSHVRELDAVVRDEIRRTLVDEFGTLIDESARAAQALRVLRGAANLRLTAWSTLIALVPGGVAAMLLAWLVPSRAEIEALRVQHDALTAAIARLEHSGGRMDLRRCGQAQRLCVRVDKRSAIYGEQADYFVVMGY